MSRSVNHLFAATDNLHPDCRALLTQIVAPYTTGEHIEKSDKTGALAWCQTCFRVHEPTSRNHGNDTVTLIDVRAEAPKRPTAYKERGAEMLTQSELDGLRQASEDVGAHAKAAFANLGGRSDPNSN